MVMAPGLKPIAMALSGSSIDARFSNWAGKRMSAMKGFLDDYDLGRYEQRYIAAELPSLPFADGTFALALVSHLLFLYTEQLSRSHPSTICARTAPGRP